MLHLVGNVVSLFLFFVVLFFKLCKVWYGKEWDAISTVFFQHCIACLPEISKPGVIVRMLERLGLFMINVRTTKQSECNKYKKKCVFVVGIHKLCLSSFPFHSDSMRLTQCSQSGGGGCAGLMSFIN